MLEKLRNWWRIPVLLVILAVFLSPLYILVGVALRSPTDISSFWRFPTHIQFENLRTAITDGKILLALLNSLIITFGASSLIVTVGALAAYPLSRNRAKTNQFVRSFILGIMMVPPLSILVPLYATIVKINGTNQFWGIITVLVTFELPLSVYLYTNFISSISTALDEAASIDGSGPIATFFLIILPQLKPVTASVFILSGIHCWNDYQFSLYILQAPDMRTVSLAISSFFSQTTSNLNAAAAAALIAILPVIILFLFLQKYFIKGMLDSAIK